jgi:hypothetical protein
MRCLLNLIREFKLGAAFAHLGQFHFTDEAVGSLILFVLGQLKPTEGRLLCLALTIWQVFISQIFLCARFVYYFGFSFGGTCECRYASFSLGDGVLSTMRASSNRYDISRLSTNLSEAAVPIILTAGKRKGNQLPAKGEVPSGKKPKKGSGSPSSTAGATPSSGGGRGHGSEERPTRSGARATSAAVRAMW